MDELLCNRAVGLCLISFRYTCMKLAERLFFKGIGLRGLSLGLEDGGRRD